MKENVMQNLFGSDLSRDGRKGGKEGGWIVTLIFAFFPSSSRLPFFAAKKNI